jgi:hypothetical protein
MVLYISFKHGLQTWASNVALNMSFKRGVKHELKARASSMSYQPGIRRENLAGCAMATRCRVTHNCKAMVLNDAPADAPATFDRIRSMSKPVALESTQSITVQKYSIFCTKHNCKEDVESCCKAIERQQECSNAMMKLKR